MTAEERLSNDPTSELWGEHRARYRYAARMTHGKRVLDVATGAGFGLRMLRASGACAVGLDYDAAALHEVRLRHATAPLIHGDAGNLPFHDAAMDVVVSFETIEHVPNAAAMVAEVRRVLKPGGSLVLSTPNRAFGPPERHTANPFHIQEFTADELRALLERHFAAVLVYGQRPDPAYRFVPFLMVQPDYSPRALAWKLMARLPFAARDRLARLLSGMPFFPGEDDYTFDVDTRGAHALLAVAR